MTQDSNYPSPLRSMAVQMHEVFAEFKRAGFSRKEALELVAKMMTSTISSTLEENKKDED